MTKKTTRANGDATKQRIIDVATQMFASLGYEATSLRQISAGAGIDIATLKYHYKDKPTLFLEVYRRGHKAFLDAVEPVLQEVDKIETEEALRVLIDDLVDRAHDFVEENLAFVRMTLYRLLEDSEDVISLEEELQTIALSRIAKKFDRLVEKELIRPIDTRALVAYLVTSFATYQIAGRVRKHWVGSPPIYSKDGRARSETFFVDLLTQMLL